MTDLTELETDPATIVETLREEIGTTVGDNAATKTKLLAALERARGRYDVTKTRHEAAAETREQLVVLGRELGLTNAEMAGVLGVTPQSVDYLIKKTVPAKKKPATRGSKLAAGHRKPTD